MSCSNCLKASCRFITWDGKRRFSFAEKAHPLHSAVLMNWGVINRELAACSIRTYPFIFIRTEESGVMPFLHDYECNSRLVILFQFNAGFSDGQQFMMKNLNHKNQDACDKQEIHRLLLFITFFLALALGVMRCKDQTLISSLNENKLDQQPPVPGESWFCIHSAPSMRLGLISFMSKSF